MTQTRWRHIGGLPGLSLTVQDAGVPEVTLHGPPGLVKYRNHYDYISIMKYGYILLGRILQRNEKICYSEELESQR